MRESASSHLLVTLLTQKPATNALSGYGDEEHPSPSLCFFALGRSGEGGTQRREDEVLTVFSVHGGTQSKPEYV